MYLWTFPRVRCDELLSSPIISINPKKVDFDNYTPKKRKKFFSGCKNTPERKRHIYGIIYIIMCVILIRVVETIAKNLQWFLFIVLPFATNKLHHQRITYAFRCPFGFSLSVPKHFSYPIFSLCQRHNI